MFKRLFDVAAAVLALVVLSPVFAAAAVLIRLSSPGPILYRARRVGRGGRPFVMYKFRTMHVAQGGAWSAVTGAGDARIFPGGALLRKLKVDELPQLVNVIRGEMSVVGPRPEDPAIVERHYADWAWETLDVRPGLSSPGSTYYYTHAEQHIDATDPEGDYVERLMPIKLALDLVYVRRASFRYDLAIIVRTLRALAWIALGRTDFPLPPEMPAAERLLAESEPRTSPAAETRSAA